MSDINQFIKETVEANKIVLFMKGSIEFPMCGFSATVVKILKDLNQDFKDVDVLKDEELRQGIKQYTDWPTIPQLYVNGEFIGGCDIIKEMNDSGELQEVLK
tara:strand:+ start:217 stop:522 length:306 start_codon:yes stop_codon:yes gene_type:complete